MQCAYKARGGTIIAVDGENVALINVFLKEQCKIYDIVSVRYKAPTIWRNGCIDVITKRTMADMRRLNNKKPAPYSFSFVAGQTAIFGQFFQLFLNEIRRYKGSEGTLVDGWWTWPEEDAHAPEPAGQPAARPGGPSRGLPARPACGWARPGTGNPGQSGQGKETGWPRLPRLRLYLHLRRQGRDRRRGNHLPQLWPEVASGGAPLLVTRPAVSHICSRHPQNTKEKI